MNTRAASFIPKNYYNSEDSMPWKGKLPSFFLMDKSKTNLNDNKNPKNFFLKNE
jgi:hypothetical protein